MTLKILITALLVALMGCSFKKNKGIPLSKMSSDTTNTNSAAKASDVDKLFLNIKTLNIPDLIKLLEDVPVATLESRDKDDLAVLDHAIHRGNTELISYLLKRKISPFRFKDSLKRFAKGMVAPEAELTGNINEFSRIFQLIDLAQKESLKDIQQIAFNGSIIESLKMTRDLEAYGVGCIAALDGIIQNRNFRLNKSTEGPYREHLKELYMVLEDKLCTNLSEFPNKVREVSLVWLSEELKNLYVRETVSNENFALILINSFSVKNAVVYSDKSDGTVVSPVYLISLTKDCRYRLNPKKQEWLNLIGTISDKVALTSESNVYVPEEDYIKPGVPIGEYTLLLEEAEAQRAKNRKTAIYSLGIEELLKSKKFDTCEGYYEE